MHCCSAISCRFPYHSFHSFQRWWTSFWWTWCWTSFPNTWDEVSVKFLHLNEVFPNIELKVSLFSLVCRPPPNIGEPLQGQIGPNAWRPMSPEGLRPISNQGMHGFGNQFPPRSADTTAPSALVRKTVLNLLLPSD